MSAVAPIRLSRIAPIVGPTWFNHTELAEGRFIIRLARTPEEIQLALRLRYQVFNLECGIGLVSSFRYAQEIDEFDFSAEHLIIIDRVNHELIGTCRLRTYEIAKSFQGFSLSKSFELGSLPADVIKDSIEVSRVCIAEAHRNSKAYFLLLKALALLSAKNVKPYFLSTLPIGTQDPTVAGRIYEALSDKLMVHEHIRFRPNPGSKCLWYKVPTLKAQIPSIFKSHFGLGFKLCGPPAFDRQFRTINFPVVLDSSAISNLVRRRFYPTCSPATFVERTSLH